MLLTGGEIAPTPNFETENDSFFARNGPILGEFVAQFGLDPEVAEKLEDIVEVTQPWVEGDHTRPENLAEVTDEQDQKLRQLYTSLGIRQERPLPDGHYDYLIVLGAIHRGNNRRLDFLNRSIQGDGVTTDEVVLLGGERLVYPEVEKSPIDQNIQELQGLQTTDPLVQKFIQREAYPKHETDLLRLASAVQLGNLTIEEEAEAYIRFDRESMPVTLIHTKAVQRPNGAPRHTTEACIGDFLRIVEPMEAAKIGFIATNPHIERTSRTAERAFADHGREDITLVPSGPKALDGYQHELYRGEVARLLYEDLLQAKAA